MSNISTTPLTPEEFDELEAILDALRDRHPRIPQWEFCEGYMAALICCRRLIMPSEYLPVLLDTDDEAQAQGLFADLDQARRFLELWMRRWNEVAAALNNQDVDDLADEAAYHPEVMDVRGLYASLSEQARAELAGEVLPSFAQLWATGFMYAVETWPEEWTPPRDKEAAEWLEDALQAIEALLDDDEDEPVFSALAEDGPPSISAARMEALGEAIWAVYDLRELWRGLGPRIETVRKEASPGRNDPCWCGSGKKYKKCHGAS